MSALGLGHHDGAAWGGHLGSRLDALVDGQLAHDERDRVLAHIARCADCHAALLEARAMKATLGRLAEADVPGDLTSRLLALAGPDSSAGPVPSRRASSSGISLAGPDGAPARGRRRGAGALSVVGLAVGAALLASAPGATGGAAGQRSGGAPAPGSAEVSRSRAGLVSVPGPTPPVRTPRGSAGGAVGRVPQVPVAGRSELAGGSTAAELRLLGSTPPPFRPRMLAAEVTLHAR